jgi:hypothetical protein
MTRRNERIYLTFNYPGATSGSKTLLTGIRRDCKKTLYITGFYEPPKNSSSQTISFLYTGDITGRIDPCCNNKYNILNFPSIPGRTVKTTNLYGPNILGCGNVRVVGNYTTEETGKNTIGCMYQGLLDGSGVWTTLTPSTDSINTIAHSTMGDLVVGNYNTNGGNVNAFIYNVKTNEYHEIIKKEAKSITAYGIWHNRGHWYTICGGVSGKKKTTVGYLVDWNNKTHEFSNWRNYSYIKANVTHFDGITSDNCGGFNLTGIAIAAGEVGFFAHVDRDNDCCFTKAIWKEIKYPDSSSTTGNSIVENIVIGVYTDSSEPKGTVNGYISIII